MLERCRDAAKSTKVRIVLTDNNIQRILNLVAEGKRDNVSRYLFDLFAK